MSEKQKKWVLFLALLASVLLAYFAPQPEEEVVAPSKSLRALPATQALETTPSILNTRKPFDPPAGNLFGIIDPPKPKVITVKANPKAPPLPFTYMGKQIEGAKTKVFLVRDNKTYVVSVGDTIDSNYVLVSLSERTLVFKYIPLNEEQALIVAN